MGFDKVQPAGSAGLVNLLTSRLCRQLVGYVWFDAKLNRGRRGRPSHYRSLPPWPMRSLARTHWQLRLHGSNCDASMG